MDTVERFWAKVDKSGECWNWTASKNYKGYGFFAVKATRPPQLVYAHRYSYELAKGPIPAGLYVLHTCDNRACVRPDHLWLGTNQDNMDDMNQKGRHHRLPGERNPYAKLTDEQVREIRALAKAGAKQRDLAKQFNISKGTIYYVVNGIRWTHI